MSKVRRNFLLGVVVISISVTREAIIGGVSLNSKSTEIGSVGGCESCIPDPKQKEKVRPKNKQAAT